MIMKKVIGFILLLVYPLCFYAQSNEAPFTLDDRDRIIKTEQKVESLRNEMNTRFENQQRQIDDLKTLFFWGFGLYGQFGPV